MEQNDDTRSPRAVGHEDGSPTNRRHSIVSPLSHQDAVDRIAITQSGRWVRPQIGGARRYERDKSNQENRRARNDLDPGHARVQFNSRSADAASCREM